MMSFMTLVMSDFREIFDAPVANEGHDVSVDSASVSDDCRCLFRPTAFPKDKTGVEILQIHGAQLLHGKRLMIEQAFF